MSLAWQLDGVSKVFRRGGWWQPELFPAVRGASLTVQEGERVGIIGESGSGKSTLARVGLGLLPRDTGTVGVLGHDTGGWSAGRWRQSRTDVQLLFQNSQSMLNPSMTIGQVLLESARLHRPDEDSEAAALSVLEAVGLRGRERAFPNELSGGERRRAGIARLLLARPKLVVADEPTSGLDANLKASLLELLFERVGPDCAVVLISHDLPLVLWATERVVVMYDGEIVDRFRPDELSTADRHPHTVELARAAGVL